MSNDKAGTAKARAECAAPSHAEDSRAAAPRIDRRLLESEVAFLFAFALGVISGADAVRRGKASTDLDELPQGFSLAGGKPDTLAGDALLTTNARWYLLEMKRGYAEFADEFDKPRVQAMQSRLLQFGGSTWDEPWGTARQAHRFLYLGKLRGRRIPELASLAYLEWLRLPSAKDRLELKKDSEIFTRFIARACQKPFGFSREQLASYIAEMNAIEGGQGGLSPEEIAGRLAVAIDEAGAASFCTYESICQDLSIEIERAPASPAEDADGDSSPKESYKSAYTRPRG